NGGAIRSILEGALPTRPRLRVDESTDHMSPAFPFRGYVRGWKAWSSQFGQNYCHTYNLRENVSSISINYKYDMGVPGRRQFPHSASSVVQELEEQRSNDRRSGQHQR